jgi:hypothetical protein
MFFSTVSLAFLAYSSLTGALPVQVSSTAVVDKSTFDKLGLYEQYAAAAYDQSNIGGSVGTKISCRVRNCPLLDHNNATVTYKFLE